MEDSDRSSIQIFIPTLQHLSVHSWFIVLQPAAQEVQTLLIEALRQDSAHFENFQSVSQCMHGYLCLKNIENPNYGWYADLCMWAPVASLLDRFPQSLHSLAHLARLW